MRALVGVLLLANLAFLGWTQGLFGGRPGDGAEPERLLRQVRPEAVQVLTEAQAASAATVATACYEAGPLPDHALAAAQAALASASVPATAWQDVAVDHPGAWIVYMGRYANPQTLARKEEELGRIRLPFDPADAASGVPAELVPGLVLGRYDRRAAADQALAQHALRGLHTARVIELRPDTAEHTLRLPRWPIAEAGRLEALRLDSGAVRFGRCAGG